MWIEDMSWGFCQSGRIVVDRLIGKAYLLEGKGKWSLGKKVQGFWGVVGVG